MLSKREIALLKDREDADYRSVVTGERARAVEWLRYAVPQNRQQLRTWLRHHVRIPNFGINKMVVPDRAVCPGHDSPWDAFCHGLFDDESQGDNIWCANRSGSKTVLFSVKQWVESLFVGGCHARILGGSFQQTQNSYQYLNGIATSDNPATQENFRLALPIDPQATKMVLRRPREPLPSIIEPLPNSSKNRRGRKAPRLKFDEADEMLISEVEEAVGIAMSMNGIDARTDIASTAHHAGGTMETLMNRMRGKNRIYTWCIFEVLERCQESRSGKNLEKCEACPLFRECTDDGRRNQTSGDSYFVPKAKQSNGFLRIDEAIAKKAMVSNPLWQADYLCQRPSVQGAIWPQIHWDSMKKTGSHHVTEEAEFNPDLDRHTYGFIDFGLNWFASGIAQVNPWAGDHVSVCWEFFHGTEVDGCRTYADMIRKMKADCPFIDKVKAWYCDPAGTGRTAQTGISDIQAFKNEGFNLQYRRILRNPYDGIRFMERWIDPATGPPLFSIHPRCKMGIESLMGYRWKRSADRTTFIDEPAHDSNSHFNDALRYLFVHHFVAYVEKFLGGKTPSWG